jgi:hypothetical protein
MRQQAGLKNASEGKVPLLIVKRIRQAILDEVFKPGDHLGGGQISREIRSQPVAGFAKPLLWKRKAQ